jgi:hypothetical protein
VPASDCSIGRPVIGLDCPRDGRFRKEVDPPDCASDPGLRTVPGADESHLDRADRDL